MSMGVVFDLEADGFLEDATRIHCIVTDTAEFIHHQGGDDAGVKGGTHYLWEHESLIGHNIMGFDIPLIKRLHQVDLNAGRRDHKDTFIISALRYPDAKGGHSLEAWGERLGGEKKVSHEDWSTYTPEMLERCSSDVRLTRSLWRHLETQLKEDSEEHGIDWTDAITMEQQVSTIHSEQVLHGVRFDVLKAARLLKEFDTKIEELEGLILKDAPWVTEVHKGPEVSKPFKKDFTLAASVLKYFEGTNTIVVGPYSRVHFRPLNLGSQVEVKAWLLKEGWKPTEWTEKGSPKLTEELKGLDDSSLGKVFSELNMIRHRRKFLLNKGGKGGALTKVREDGRVPAEALTCATPTGRYRHGGAVCNIPKSNRDKKTGELLWYPSGRQKVPYGTEIRSLFCVPEMHTMLGSDLQGIEARVMCHFALRYLGGKNLMDLVLDGDFHQFNADNWGVSRDDAKSGLYALDH